ncbi:hypothetical protein [Paenibacillus sp. N3.4]|uniref:hypothetical protein n=1 Tax=Paenibacillus sp. N3.4 TaxID=2603222 RepID=UPI0011CB263E|nr:hypothetical protein [Paenibacillus sp. N3.4]TXK77659.1 hypothetical protein FU659_22200 [Paenibacillus sp. N3.4]
MDYIRLSDDAELLASNAMASHEDRSSFLLDRQIQPDVSKDLYGGTAIANLSRAIYVEESNQSLVRTAKWFVHPHLYGRDPQGESDFAAIKLIRALYQFEATGLLQEETIRTIRQFYLNDEFESKYKSENHMLLFHTSRYLAAQKYPQEDFRAYGKMAGISWRRKETSSGNTLFFAPSEDGRSLIPPAICRKLWNVCCASMTLPMIRNW